MMAGLLERGLGNLDGAVGGRHTGIDGNMQKGFFDVIGTSTGIGGGADMHRKLFIMAKGRQKRDGQQAALTTREAGP